MEYSTGKLLSIFLFAVILSSIAAWVVAYRYRKAMQRWMQAPVAGIGAAPLPTAPESPPAPWPVSLEDNRRVGVRLTLVLIGISCLIALSSSALWMQLVLPEEPFSPKRVVTVALLHLWPVIPAIGLMWRWSRWRVLGVLLLWCVFCFLIFLWRSIELRPLQLLYAIAVEIGPTLVLVALILMGSATRAVAPWLLLPFTGLVWASHAGIDVLAVMVEQQSPVLRGIIAWMPNGWLSVFFVGLMFALAPWLVAWWPLRRMARALGRAYARKRLSELLVVFTTVWAFSLTERALTSASSAGLWSLALFLPLLWIPLVMLPYAKLHRRPGRPPTLLVLRVFQRDQQVQALFDHVIERWRLSGNTVMIAGTDLAIRTLDADDIFTFLDGRLQERFIRTAAEVAPRLAGFDLLPDADGRYRVNECYCHDTTWQDALNALVHQSDVVLMDLRGFQAHNAGCLYELSTLARAQRPLRVMVLTDGQTDRAAATTAVGQVGAERFVWIDASRVDGAKRREVLAGLFGPMDAVSAKV